MRYQFFGAPLILTCSVCACLSPRVCAAAENYWACVSNEKGGDVAVIDASSLKLIANIPVGKRPRGIHASPDGKTLYVALSGRPIEGPPKLDKNGNPIFSRDDDEEAENKSDHAADGIGVVDLTTLKLVKKLPAGSDPEQFAVAPDGKHLYVANEDVGTVSVTNIETGKVEHIVPVSKEPEGVAVRPGGREVYVTCETNGDVFAIDTTVTKVAAKFSVPSRPRSIAFSPDGMHAFVPSESSEQLTLVDTLAHKALKTVRLPTGSRAMGMQVSLDGKKLYVTTGRGGTVLVVNTTDLSVANSIRVGKRPWGVGLSPDGARLFVANGPSDDVSVIDVVAKKEVSKVKVGDSPWGVTVVPAPTTSRH